MGELRTLAKVAEIEPGKAKSFPNGEAAPIGVFNVGGEFFAIEDRCTHAEVRLTDGWVDEKCVSCPWHGAQFDLETGEALSLPAILGVKSYPVEIEDGEIRVRIDHDPRADF
jgi:3-phenylpropionate/trans-cinnamate dioxygenase ferredoxin subunit